MDPEYKSPLSKTKLRLPDSGVQLHCPDCAKDIPAADINIAKAIAKCNHCQTVFSFEEEIKNAVRRPEILLPEGIELLELQSELDIRFKWRKMKALNGFLVFFTLFWNLMLLPFVGFAVLSGEYTILLGTSVHILVGAGFLYHIITRLFNTTQIIVDEYQLSVEHRPFKIPFFYPDRNVDVNDIQQLYVRKYVASSSKSGYKSYAYALHAKVLGAEDISLVKGVKNKEKVQYLEQEIERYLGIPDERIEEETL